MDLDKKYGIFTLRIWGLVLNFIANFLAMYGTAKYFKDEMGPALMILGLVLTVLCIGILSKPQQ